MSSGLQLPGSLSVTQSTLSDVGTSMDIVVQSAVAEAARSSADGTASFTYYIQADYDINSAISYTASSPLHATDDVYSMTAISVTSAQATNPSLNLPSASSVTVSAGDIDAQTSSGHTIGNFPVVLTVSVDSNGRMTSTIGIIGSDVIATEADDPAKAQVVYWPFLGPADDVKGATADILSSTLTPNQLASNFFDSLAQIDAQYNGQDMVDSWTISVSAVSAAYTGNILSQHARYLGKNGSTSVFAAGDKLVCATPFSYGVSINDYVGQATTIVAATNVFGVLQQS